MYRKVIQDYAFVWGFVAHLQFFIKVQSYFRYVKRSLSYSHKLKKYFNFIE